MAQSDKPKSASLPKSQSPTEAKELDAGMMVRRALFLLVLAGLFYYFLGLDFRGLSHAKGMEQAQIAREIARANGFTTRSIAGIAYTQVEKHLQAEEGPAVSPPLLGLPDTYHSPLNPIFNSLFLGMAKAAWEMKSDQTIYTPDVIIAGTSMVLLLASIGITYLLVSRIFDPRIGGVAALLMLLSELLWRFSQSGLPQMLMLFLFSFATYFLYKAVETMQTGKTAYLWVALAAGFFGLLAWSHWLTVWIFAGALLFGAFYFQPRGLHTAIFAGVYLLVILWWPLLHNMRYTGNPLGAGLYAFYAGLGGTGSEEALMRDIEQTAGSLNFQGFVRKIISNSLLQLRYMYDYLGGIVAAPLFFLSLLHPFRRKEIADFRWSVLLMWIFAVFGMTLYGIQAPKDEPTDPNNLHILFIPLMAGYGLAFLSVLWNRLDVPLHIPVIRNGHFILAVAISALPFLLQLPIRVIDSNRLPDQNRCHLPYYVPAALAVMGEKVKQNEVVVTDIPWAVAWYMDRTALWLPKDKGQLARIQEKARDKGQPVNTLLLSPLTLWKPLTSTFDDKSPDFEWRHYMLLYPMTGVGSTADQRAALQSIITADMPIKVPLMTAAPFGNLYLFMKDSTEAVAMESGSR